MSILFGLGILGVTLYLAAHLSGTKAVPDENVPAVPMVPGSQQSPVLQQKAVQQPVFAPVQQTVIDEQKGTELNIQAHQMITEGKYAEAIPVLERALKSFPKGTTAPAYKFVLYNLGHSLRRVGRAKEAIPYLEKCVQLDPAWEKARGELGIAQIAAKTTQ